MYLFQYDKIISKTPKTLKPFDQNDMTSTFSVYMNASTLKNHCVWKPSDPLYLKYLEFNGKNREILSTKGD
jgi:hypothetical protein